MEVVYLILLGLAGIVMHVSSKFRNTITGIPKNGMHWRDRLTIAIDQFDLLGNLGYASGAFILILILAFLKEQVTEMGFPVTYLNMFFYGYFADSAFKNLKPGKLN